MPVSQTTGLPQSRYRPLTATTLPPAIQPPGPPQMDPAQVGTPALNDPNNAPKNALDLENEANALPPKPAVGQPLSVGKAQGGDGPAFNPQVQDPTLNPTPFPIAPTQPTPTTQPVATRPRPITPTTQPVAPIAPTTSPVGNSLRSETYLPGSDPRLTSAMGATDKAGAALQGMDRNAMQTGNEARYRSLYGTGQVNANADLLGAPDRTALAMQKLKDFDAASQETRFNEERDLGRNIAKFGRTGLQANADNFGEIQRRIAGDRGRLANELAYSVADGDINDRFRKLDFQTGLDERNADRSFDRTNASLDRATGQTDRGVSDLFDQFNAAGSLEDRIFGEGQSNRNEFRTERGREDTQAQQTIENRLKEFEIQQQLEDAKIRRAAALAQAGGGY